MLFSTSKMRIHLLATIQVANRLYEPLSVHHLARSKLILAFPAAGLYIGGHGPPCAHFAVRIGPPDWGTGGLCPTAHQRNIVPGRLLEGSRRRGFDRRKGQL